MGLLGRYAQQPNETIDYNLDYTEFFGGRGDDPASFVATASTGITIAGTALNGLVGKVTISGGSPGAQYKITVRMTTTSVPPIVKEDDFMVRVKEI